MGFATPRARDGPRRSVAGRRRIPQARQAPSPSRAWAVAGDWIAAILPLLALLTALAVWFGVTLVKTRARYFGLDPSVLGFSTRDYVLRSSTELLEPMLYLLLGGIAVLAVHVAVRWALPQPRWSRAVVVAAALAVPLGLFTLTLGIWFVRNRSFGMYGGSCADPTLGAWYRPWLVAAGLVLTVYGGWMLNQRLASTPVTWTLTTRVGCSLICLVVVICTFWTFLLYAQATGVTQSYRLACGHLQELPRVAVYSTQPLGLSAKSGVTVEHVDAPGTGYQWRYAGLRLLVRSDDRYFLLPTGWVNRDDVAIVLGESPTLRFEYQRPEVQ